MTTVVFVVEPVVVVVFFVEPVVVEVFVVEPLVFEPVVEEAGFVVIPEVDELVVVVSSVEEVGSAGIGQSGMPVGSGQMPSKWQATESVAMVYLSSIC